MILIYGKLAGAQFYELGQPLPHDIAIYKDIIVQISNVLYNKTLYCLVSYDAA